MGLYKIALAHFKTEHKNHAFVKGTKKEILNIPVILHKRIVCVRDKKEKLISYRHIDGYTVSDFKTGYVIAYGDTKAKALAQAKNTLFKFYDQFFEVQEKAINERGIANK